MSGLLYAIYFFGFWSGATVLLYEKETTEVLREYILNKGRHGTDPWPTES